MARRWFMFSYPPPPGSPPSQVQGLPIRTLGAHLTDDEGKSLVCERKPGDRSIPIENHEARGYTHACMECLVISSGDVEKDSLWPST